MAQVNRPSEGNPMFGCLILALVAGLLIGGGIALNYFQEQAKRLAEEKAAAQKQETECNRLISELNKLPPGRIDDFNTGGEQRRKFLTDNPSFREQLDSAEDEWLARSLTELGKLPDPAAVIGGLRQLRSGCQKGSGERLLPQVRQALDRAVRSGAEQSAGLLGKDNVQALDVAVRCLAPFIDDKEGPPEALKEAQREALDRCVKDLSGRLEKVPVDDGTAMVEWLKARQAVEKAARAVVEPLRQAEGRWLDMTIAAVLKEVEPQAAHQPEKVFARVERTRTTYAELFVDHPDTVNALTAGEGRCLQSVVELAVAEARQAGNPAAASARLRRTATVYARLLEAHEGPANTLREARRAAVNAALQQAGTEARTLLKGDRIQAAASLAERLYKDFAPDAEAVGLADSLVRFRDDWGYLADLARQAGKLDPP
jgi:hypothetical protein